MNTAPPVVTITSFTDVRKQLSDILTNIQRYHLKWNKSDGGATTTILRQLSADWVEAEKLVNEQPMDRIGGDLLKRYHAVRERHDNIMRKPRPRDVANMTA